MHKPAMQPWMLGVCFLYCFAVMILFAISAAQAVATIRWITPRKHTIRVSLLMELPAAAPTTAGRNLETFVAE